jgi:alpha-L-fucosidase
MDWHHPDYLPRKPWNDEANANPDFERYVAYMKGELKELLTGYGPIGILWFDGQWENTWTYDRGVDLYNYVRGLQPDIIVNNRVGRDAPPGRPKVGDYGTPEQTIPASGYGPGVDWETCMTMNDTWGFKKQDNDWKSTETLIHNLIDIASKGGNYLLNVGPTGEGLIPDASVERLQAIGQWMKVNGDAIYSTTASPFSRQLPWGRCTSKTTGRATTLYFHVFNWPADGRLLVPGLKTSPRRISLLANAKIKVLPSKMTEDGLLITLPKAAPDPISSTIAARFTEPLDISPVYIKQSKDGSIDLPAAEAELHGNAIRYEKSDTRDDIVFGSNPDETAEWQFKAGLAGRFVVTAQIAAQASGSFDIVVAGKTIHGAAPETGGLGEFESVDLGAISLPAPGVFALSVRPVKDGWQPMNLKLIGLQPIVGQP